jgi:hypothetical protein
MLSNCRALFQTCPGKLLSMRETGFIGLRPCSV